MPGPSMGLAAFPKRLRLSERLCVDVHWPQRGVQATWRDASLDHIAAESNRI